MPVSAWIMLLFGVLLLYGGFFWCLMIALKNKGKVDKLES